MFKVFYTLIEHSLQMLLNCLVQWKGREGKGREEKRKEKVRKRKRSGGKKVFPLVCLDTNRNRRERCEI